MTHGWVILALLLGGCAAQTTSQQTGGSVTQPASRPALQAPPINPDPAKFAKAPQSIFPILPTDAISKFDEIDLIGSIDLLPDGSVRIFSNGLTIRRSDDTKPAESPTVTLAQYQSARFEIKTDPAMHVFNPRFGGVVDFLYLGVGGDRIILARVNASGEKQLISVPCYNRLPPIRK